MGSVVATCSGQRHFANDDQDQTVEADNSLKVWSMPFLHPSVDAEGQELDSGGSPQNNGREVT
jgi:hypothetical protein